jgi:hypothetical protein
MGPNCLIPRKARGFQKEMVATHPRDHLRARAPPRVVEAKVAVAKAAAAVRKDTVLVVQGEATPVAKERKLMKTLLATGPGKRPVVSIKVQKDILRARVGPKVQARARVDIVLARVDGTS